MSPRARSKPRRAAAANPVRSALRVTSTSPSRLASRASRPTDASSTTMTSKLGSSACAAIPSKQRCAWSGPPRERHYDRNSRIVHLSARPHVSGRLAGPTDNARDLVGVVAFDRLDAAVGKHLVDDPDMVVSEHDQVAGRRRYAGTVGDRAAGLLRPVPDVADVAETLTLGSERDTGLLGDPRGEVRAPRLSCWRTSGSRSVHRDPCRVVGPRRLLGLPDLALCDLDHRAGACASGLTHRAGRHRSLQLGRERCAGRRGRGGGRCRCRGCGADGRRDERGLERRHARQGCIERHIPVIGSTAPVLSRVTFTVGARNSEDGHTRGGPSSSAVPSMEGMWPRGWE